jgi:hypothetical protein
LTPLWWFDLGGFYRRANVVPHRGRIVLKKFALVTVFFTMPDVKMWEKFTRCVCTSPAAM